LVGIEEICKSGYAQRIEQPAPGKIGIKVRSVEIKSPVIINQVQALGGVLDPECTMSECGI
jgi:hypothetical protein